MHSPHSIDILKQMLTRVKPSTVICRKRKLLAMNEKYLFIIQQNCCVKAKSCVRVVLQLVCDHVNVRGRARRSRVSTFGLYL